MPMNAAGMVGTRPTPILPHLSGRTCPSQVTAPRTRIARCAAAKQIFALDFDGVLVDSAGEVTASAILAAKQRWPQLFSTLGAGEEKELFQLMLQVRPVLVRGYESMVMLRMLREGGPSQVPVILSDWASVLPRQTEAWGESAEGMMRQFEEIRNEWMNTRTESWMQMQRPYPGVIEALTSSPHPFYIVTSKAGHRVSALMRAVMNIDLSPDDPRMYSSLLPPEEKKAEALVDISKSAEMPADASSSPSASGAPGVQFVDDRLETLLAMQSRSDLKHVRLYMADWGYSTAAEKAAALATPGIEVLTLQQFCQMLAGVQARQPLTV